MPQASLRLAPYDRRFLDLSWDWLRDPEVKALTLTPDFSREDQIAFFDRLPGRADYHIWGVELDGTGPIGAAGLKNVRGHRAEYWGYIGERAWWGKGLGRQLMAVVEKKAVELGFTELDLKVSVDNPRAIALYEKTGYVRESGELGVHHMVKRRL